MNFFRTHPLIDASLGTGAILIVGALFVRTQLGAPVRPATDETWGGVSGAYVNTVSGMGRSLAQAAPTTPQGARDVGLIQLSTQNEIGTGPQDTSDGFDLSAFAALLSNPHAPVAQADSSIDTSAYAFIPSGLVATTTLTKPRTALQDALYYYGNEVGDTIVSFENSHPDQPAILKNHAEQPGNPDTQAALKRLADDITHVGESIDGIEPVPTQAKSAHVALVAAYKELGAKLATVSHTQGNDPLYDAIVAYDASADDFAKKFVTLALLFQAYGVTFSPGDGGSVFVFPSSGL